MALRLAGFVVALPVVIAGALAGAHGGFTSENSSTRRT